MKMSEKAGVRHIKVDYWEDILLLLLMACQYSRLMAFLLIVVKANQLNESHTILYTDVQFFHHSKEFQQLVSFLRRKKNCF